MSLLAENAISVNRFVFCLFKFQCPRVLEICDHQSMRALFKSLPNAARHMGSRPFHGSSYLRENEVYNCYIINYSNFKYFQIVDFRIAMFKRSK